MKNRPLGSGISQPRLMNSEIGISVLAGYKYSSVQISMPIDYSFSIDHQAR